MVEKTTIDSVDIDAYDPIQINRRTNRHTDEQSKTRIDHAIEGEGERDTVTKLYSASYLTAHSPQSVHNTNKLLIMLPTAAAAVVEQQLLARTDDFDS